MASANQTPSEMDSFSAPKELPVKAPVVARAHCAQCGKAMRHMPFFIDALTCRECYGLERYRKGIGMTIGSNSVVSSVSEDNITA